MAATGLRFEWDERKNRTNQKRHGISFEEAETTFFDEHAILLGFSVRLRVLVVCHCHRRRDDVIRIISARKADAEEQADYTARRRR